ncbi:MAG TPA: hypothetical protein PKW95_12775 [bacterium]|nr:hypothetical protein [bacterium]
MGIMPDMRRAIFLLLIVLVFPGFVWGQDRLDLRPADGEGYRLTIGGQTLFDVFPLDENRARLIDADGQERVLDLPPAAPLTVDIPPFAPPVYGECPRFAVESFATLLDGLSLLLTDAAQAGDARDRRFAATVRLTTHPGRIGRTSAEVLERGARLPDETLDAQVERFLAAGPLPPLRGGQATVEVVATVAGGERPLLTVWVSHPRGEACFDDPDAGVLFHEPLGLPAAVRRHPLAAGAAAAYADDWARARAELLTLLAQEKDAVLFGNWRIDVFTAETRLAEIMSRRGAGEVDPLLMIEARLALLQRRVDAAIAAMNAVAAGAADRELAEQARFCARAWQRRRLSSAREFSAGAPPSLFALETELLRDEMSERSLAERLSMLRTLLASAGARLDFDLLVRSRLHLAAEALAASAGDREPQALWRAMDELVPVAQPLADRLLFNAAARLLGRGRDAQAVELLRALLGRYPTSPFAPEAAWRLVLVELRGGRQRAAAELALTLHELFAPDSEWGRKRGAAGDSAAWAYGLPRTIGGAARVRERALLLARDFYFDAYRETSDAADLQAAEHAARLALDTVSAPTLRRRQWLTLGDILLAGGNFAAARTAYAHVTLDERDDALRLEGLRRLGAGLTPQASRVAAALRDDPQVGGLLTPLLP